MLKKALILTSLAVALAVLMALWVFDKLMVLSGRDSTRRFFPLSVEPLNETSTDLQLEPLRRSA